MQQTDTVRSAARLTISYQTEAPEGVPSVDDLTLGPLLEKALEISAADGAYVYRFSPDGGALELIAWRGTLPINIGHFAAVSPAGVAALAEAGGLVALHSGAALDRRFHNFPEFVGRHFEGVVSLRLTANGATVGLVNFCRRQEARWTPDHISFLRRLGDPLSKLLTPASSEALRELEQQIADRQLIEEAKTILRDRNGWTEQLAYAELRRTSRRRRERIAVIAREILSGIPLAVQKAGGS